MKQKFVCGGLTGTLATAIVYPMDILKTYLIVNQDQKHLKNSISIIDI
jgi:hypothetical protein